MITIITVLGVFLLFAVGFYINIFQWLKKEYRTFQEYIPQNQLEYERQIAVMRILEMVIKKITLR